MRRTAAVLIAAAVAGSALSATLDPRPRLGELRRAFEPRAEGRLLHRAHGLLVALEDGTAMTVTPLPAEPVRFTWVGSNPDARWDGIDPFAGRAHLRTGDTVPLFAAAHALALYPGLDAVARSAGAGMEIVLHGDPAAARLAVEGAQALHQVGEEIVVQAAGGTLRLRGPALRLEPDGAIAFGNDEVSFVIESAAPSVAATDPVRLAVDGAGNVFLAASTSTDTFVAKLTPDGLGLAWVTYIGGESAWVPGALALDSKGGVLVAGSAGTEAFVAALEASGDVAWAAILGGKGTAAKAVAADGEGRLWVAGTQSGQAWVAQVVEGEVRESQTLGPGSAEALALDREGKRMMAGVLNGRPFLARQGQPERLAGRGAATAVALDGTGETWIGGPRFLARTKPGEASTAEELPLELAGTIVAAGRHVWVGGSAADGAVVLRWRDGPEETVTLPGRLGGMALGPHRALLLAGFVAEPVFPPGTIVAATSSGGGAFLARVPAPDEGPRAAGCPGTINFDNTAGTGAWTTATNWDLDRLPNATDDVCIGAGFAVTLASGTHEVLSLTTQVTASLALGGGTLTLDSASHIGGAFSMSAGILNGAGNVTVAGPFTWTGGTMAGGSAFSANGGLSVTGAVNKELNPRTLQTPAATTWSGAGQFRLGGGSTVTSTALWDVQGDLTMAAIAGGGTFSNGSTFRKSAGAGTLTVTSVFDSTGTVEIQSGTLTLNGGGSHSGSITGTAATTLRFGGLTHTLSNASSVAVPSVAVAAGTVNANGSYNASVATTVASPGNLNFNASATVTSLGALTLSGGSLNFNTGDLLGAPSLTMSGGTLGGGDTLAVSGLTSWSDGVMTDGGTTRAEGGLSLTGTNDVELNPRTLRVQGASTWTGTGQLRVGGGSVVNNLGTWDVQADAAIFPVAGGGTVTNGGTFRKSAGAGTFTVGAPFTSSGAVEALSGTLAFTAGCTQTAGSMLTSGGTVSASTPIQIQGGILKGTGPVSGGVVSAGEIAPGLSPGTLPLTGGAYSQSASGSLAIELGGLTPGTQHDRLAVTGAAALAGGLTATFVNGFVPALGDGFTILTAGSRTGTFATTSLPALAAGRFWFVRYTDTAVELEVVPLPAGRVPGDLGAESDLLLTKSGANLALSWGTTCIGTDTDYSVYEGTLGSFASHVPSACSTAGATSWSLSPGAGNRYYLVVAHNGAGEGSYGYTGAGAERPTSASACHLQSIATCP